jgi:FkbH-like protein
MYETEANIKIESGTQIPTGVLNELGMLRATLVARTVLPWSEHCTECVWPTCYSTCDLYVPRNDGRCQRFAEGMVRVDCREALNGYLLKISFKQWGKLWTPGNVRLYGPNKFQRIERRDRRIGQTLVQISIPRSIKSTLAAKRYSWKKRVAQRPSVSGELPTSFVVECFNPNSETVKLSLTMRPTSGEAVIPFQALLEIQPGFQCLRIPVEEIARVLDLRSEFSIELVPNIDSQVTTLYFGLLDFVKESKTLESDKPAEPKNNTLKCIVWDLDNTLWNGILVEDGPEKLTLRKEIPDILKALDARGILNSIASKNNREEGLEALKRYGLEEYFLYPQISWGPKSEGIKAIAKSLNIGLDTFLFVDDSIFEIEEVRSALPDVRIMTADKCESILTLPECQVPVTAESSNRRKMYRTESERHTAAQDFGADYLAFLRHCQIRVNISPLTEENLRRVHELTQRTNQMNFSGNRYRQDVLEALMENHDLDTYVIDCEDRFGAYGVVGFSIVDHREPRMTDLMFSCRVQSKRVEHAFLAHIIRKYVTESGRNLYANYRKTPRNAPSGKVFSDLGMLEMGTSEDGVTSLAFLATMTLPNDGIIEVIEQDRRLCPAEG